MTPPGELANSSVVPTVAQEEPILASPLAVCIGVDVMLTSGGGVLFPNIEDPSVFSILNTCGTTS